jgi:hypothetical protein
VLVLLDVAEAVEAEEPAEPPVERVALDQEPELVIAGIVVRPDDEALDQILGAGRDAELAAPRPPPRAASSG